MSHSNVSILDRVLIVCALILVILIGLILWTTKHCGTRFLEGDSCKIAGEQKAVRTTALT
jgi:hypothetical protein